jgi:hypothetical protein
MWRLFAISFLQKSVCIWCMGFFFFSFFFFFCGFLARIGKFVKKKKTGYSVFFWGCIPKRLAGKTFLFAALAFFFFSFLFLLGCFDARILQKKRKNEKMKKLAIGVFFV